MNAGSGVGPKHVHIWQHIASMHLVDAETFSD